MKQDELNLDQGSDEYFLAETTYVPPLSIARSSHTIFGLLLLLVIVLCPFVSVNFKTMMTYSIYT